jgi:hypothetical protein
MSTIQATNVVSTGVYSSTLNASSFTIGSTFTANTTGVYHTSGAVTDVKGNVRDLPLNSKSATYVTVANDAGGVITTTANVTVNGAVFSTGQAVTIYNNSSANISIISGTGATIYYAGTSATDTRTLLQRGVATAFMVSSNVFVISGAGLI